MTIVEALQSGDAWWVMNPGNSDGTRFLQYVVGQDEWLVYQRKPSSRKSKELYRGKSEANAVAHLLGKADLLEEER